MLGTAQQWHHGGYQQNGPHCGPPTLLQLRPLVVSRECRMARLCNTMHARMIRHALLGVGLYSKTFRRDRKRPFRIPLHLSMAIRHFLCRALKSRSFSLRVSLRGVSSHRFKGYPWSPSRKPFGGLSVNSTQSWELFKMKESWHPPGYFTKQ